MKKVLFSVLGLFVLSIMGMAQDTYFEPNIHQSGNMEADGLVWIDGVEQTSSTLELGAFCGDECRGAALPFEYEGHFEYYFVINGNDGDVFTFKLYDHSIGQILDLECTCSVPYVNDGTAGTWEDYFEFTFVSPAQTWELPITGHANDLGGGYYLIAPPCDVDPANQEQVTNILSGNYDFYYFDQKLDLE